MGDEPRIGVSVPVRLSQIAIRAENAVEECCVDNEEHDASWRKQLLFVVNPRFLLTSVADDYVADMQLILHLPCPGEEPGLHAESEDYESAVGETLPCCNHYVET